MPSDTLQHVHALRELQISRNPIERVSAAAFVAVPNLFRLEMSDCEISILHEDAFRGLVKLQWLKLDGNRLQTLADGSLMPLNSIRELHLHGNPWVCDCQARYLRHWLDQVNPSRAEPPTCAAPGRLRRRAFEAVPLSQFACPPRIREGSGKVTAWSGDNVTLSCSVSASPEARVRWLWRGRLVANGSVSQPPGTQYRVFEHGREEKTSMLTLQRVSERTAGRYVCAAQNPAGSVTGNVTVDVSGRKAVTHVTLRLDNGLLIGTLSAGLAVSLAACACACLLCARLRQRPAARAAAATEAPQVEMNHKPTVANHVNAKPAAGSSGASGAARGNHISAPRPASAAAATSNSTAAANKVSHPRYRDYARVPQTEPDRTPPPVRSLPPRPSPALHGRPTANGTGAGDRAVSRRQEGRSPAPAARHDTADGPRVADRADRRDWSDETRPVSRSMSSARPVRPYTDLERAPGTPDEPAPMPAARGSSLRRREEPYSITRRLDCSGGGGGGAQGTSSVSGGSSAGYGSLPRRLMPRVPPQPPPPPAEPSPDSELSRLSDLSGSLMSSTSAEPSVTRRMPTLTPLPDRPTSPPSPPPPLGELTPSRSRTLELLRGPRSAPVRRRHPSLPTSPVLGQGDEDGYMSDYCGRYKYRPRPAYNPYTYHAVQLDRYLQEYRTLQDQLITMQYSCDTMERERRRVGRRSLPSIGVTDALDLNLPAAPPAKTLKPILKNRDQLSVGSTPSTQRKSPRFSSTNDYFSYHES